MISMFLAMALLAQDPAVDAAKAAPVTATPVASAGEATPTKAKKGGNSDERFCRNEAPMGTRIPKKRCYNKQELEMRQLEERRALEKIQNDARAPISR